VRKTRIICVFVISQVNELYAARDQQVARREAPAISKAAIILLLEHLNLRQLLSGNLRRGAKNDKLIRKGTG
jgi:hypothetical protein